MNDNPTPDDNVEETPPDDNLADAPADDDAAAASSTDSSDGLDEGEHEDEHAAFEAAQAETARAELPML